MESTSAASAPTPTRTASSPGVARRSTRGDSEEQRDRCMEARLKLLERPVGEEIVRAHDEVRARPPEDAEQSADAGRPRVRLEVLRAHDAVEVARVIAE